jgi:hypothetical protein
MTKLLLENWKRFITENTGDNIWYHTTSPQVAQQVIKTGLKINSNFNKSQMSQDYVRRIYGMNPIYISKEQGLYKNGVVLSVDVSGMDLVVDIPTLISDYNAQLGEDYEHIWFEEDFTPFEMFDWIDGNGALHFDDLLNPNSPVAKAMIELTKTAAVMQDIPPDRIKIVGEI